MKYWFTTLKWVAYNLYIQWKNKYKPGAGDSQL
jgi:hypothetical protein